MGRRSSSTSGRKKIPWASGTETPAHLGHPDQLGRLSGPDFDDFAQGDVLEMLQRFANEISRLRRHRNAFLARQRGDGGIERLLEKDLEPRVLGGHASSVPEVVKLSRGRLFHAYLTERPLKKFPTAPRRPKDPRGPALAKGRMAP